MASSALSRILAVVALVAFGIAFWMPATFVPPPSSRHTARRDLLWHGLALGAVPLVIGETFEAQPVAAGYARWVGEYDDRAHPGCEREIRKIGGKYVISGTSSTIKGQKACNNPGAVQKWSLDGKVDSSLFGVGKEMSIDLSPKGGPTEMKVKFDSGLGSEGGLVFPDGTSWKKISGLAPSDELVRTLSELKSY